MKIQPNVYWPGKARNGTSRWDDLRLAVATLPVDGTIAVELDSYDEVDDARKAAQKYAMDTLRSREGGWRLITTRRGKTLFLRKVSA